MNRRKSMRNTRQKNTYDPQIKHRLGTVGKIFYGGGGLLKPVSRRQPHPQFRRGSIHIDVCFAWKTPSLSMHHLLEHINRDIKRRWSKDEDSTVQKRNTGAKEIQKLNPGGPWQQPKHQLPTSSSTDKSSSGNRHRVWSPTSRHAIKEENKVANRDLVDHQACSPLQYSYVIDNLL